MSQSPAESRLPGGGLRSYGGEGGDTRVARRRAALIDGALEALGGDGSGRITVRGVCKNAGLTARYFYESFDSVEALVAQTFDDVIAEITDRAVEAFAGSGPARARVRRAVTAIVEVVDGDRRKGRLLFSQHLLSPTLAERRMRSTEAFAVLTVESAAGYGELTSGPARLAVAHFRVGGFARVLAAWLDGLVALDRAGIVDICTDMLTAQVSPS